MARSKKSETATGGFDFGNVAVSDSAGMPARAARDEKPNPLLGAVQASLNEGVAKLLPGIPVDNQKEADNYLRRAAVKLGCGIEIRPQDNGNGTVDVHFQAKAEKRSRAYTVEDVRAWAMEQGWNQDDLFPKVPREISNAYREAHGHKVNKIND